MVGGNWMDTDGVYRQYGTTKAIPETGGDFLAYGETRQQEYTIDLTTLTATPIIQSNTTFMPVGVYIESVELDVEVAATGASTLSVGLINNDRVTIASNTGFLQAVVVGTLTQGNRVIYAGPPAQPGGAGAYVGLAAGTPTPVGYVTALGTATPFTTGRVKVRINYRTTSTITQ